VFGGTPLAVRAPDAKVVVVQLFSVIGIDEIAAANERHEQWGQE
jgi:hypothetical protein